MRQTCGFAMSTEAPERKEFQAEVKQLLDIVVHSLYTDREIFLRELVSNAADALEKLRYRQLQGEPVCEDHLDLEINISSDDTAGTLTIQDFGVGMTRTELTENLGTIARSGSKAFAQALQAAKESPGAAPSLIGQFGVGFYSAFMVAEEVRVYTRAADPEGEPLVWTSDGGNGYTVEDSPGQRRGAKVVLKLKEEAKEFAKGERLEAILRQYSSFVPFPLTVNGKRVNKIEAIWLKQKSEITDEEYEEFYRFQGQAFDKPRQRLHFHADAPLSIHTLLFTPEHNPEGMGFGRMEPGVALYCKKVLIDPKPKGLLPDWLRYLRGVVDSADLPLNISRESMQDSQLVRKLRQVITGRYLKYLDEQQTKEPEAYRDFYASFGGFLKEGIITDHEYKDRLAKLLRFESSLLEAGTSTSLKDYVERMPEGQEKIYYLYGRDHATLLASPGIEALQARNREVLFLYEPAEELVMRHVTEFEGKGLVSADEADLDLDDVSKDREGEALRAEDQEALDGWLKEQLGETVTQVRASKRLTESPALVLNADKMLSPNLRRAMRNLGQGADLPQPVVFEYNARHPLVKRLAQLRESDAETAGLLAGQLFDNAMLTAGYLENPRPMVDRLYKILGKL